jgi:hypothetical protein
MRLNQFLTLHSRENLPAEQFVPDCVESILDRFPYTSYPCALSLP